MGERSVKALSWAPGVISFLLLGLCGYWREYLKFKWAMHRLTYEARLFLNCTSVLLRFVEGSQALAMGLQLSVPMPPVQRLEASKRHPRECTRGVMAARQCIRRELVNVLRLAEYSLYAMRARGFSTGFSSSSCSLFKSHKWLNVEEGRGRVSDDLILERLKCLRDDVKQCLSAVSVILLKNHHQSMGLARESRTIALELTTACEYSRQHIEEVTVASSAPCSPSVGPVVKGLDSARLQCETMLIHLYEAQMEVRQDQMTQDAAIQVASRAACAVRDRCQKLTEMTKQWDFIHVPLVQKKIHKEGGKPLPPTSSLSMSHTTHVTTKETCAEIALDSNSAASARKGHNFESGYNLELSQPQNQAGDEPETKSESFPEIYESNTSHASPEEELLIPPSLQQIPHNVNSNVDALASVMEELHDMLSCRDPLQPCKKNRTTGGDQQYECIGQDGMMMTSVKGKQPSTSFLNELQATISATKH